MGHTLEGFAASCHRILTERPDRAGREQVCALLREVLTGETFVTAHLTDDGPERKILYEDPQLGFCILAHVYAGPKESAPHDHGPSWAIYGQARGETVMSDWSVVAPAAGDKPAKVTRARSYTLTPGAACPNARPALSSAAEMNPAESSSQRFMRHSFFSAS